MLPLDPLFVSHAKSSRSDATIDLYIFGLDRLLSQLVQDCSPSPLPPSSSNLTVQVTPSAAQNRTIIYHTLPSKPSSPMRKSVECLYMTPTMNKRPASTTAHGQRLLNHDSRPKSASTILIQTRGSMPPTSPSSSTNRFERAANRHPKRRTYSSDDDLIRDAPARTNPCELVDGNRSKQQSNGHSGMDQCEQKTRSLPDYSRVKGRVINDSYSVSPTTETRHHNVDGEKTLPTPPTPSSGIRRFVLSGLKFFVASPSQQPKRAVR